MYCVILVVIVYSTHVSLGAPVIANKRRLDALKNLLQRHKRQDLPPPSLPVPPSLPLSIPDGQSSGPGGQGVQPSDQGGALPSDQGLNPASSSGGQDPNSGTSPSDSGSQSTCDQLMNGPSDPSNKFGKIIQFMNMCSGGQKGGAGGGPGRPGKKGIHGGRKGSSPSSSGSNPAPSSGSSPGSSPDSSQPIAGSQFNAGQDPNGNPQISDKKGIKGIYEEENSVKGGKDWNASSKKCIAGTVCTESGLGSGGFNSGMNVGNN